MSDASAPPPPAEPGGPADRIDPARRPDQTDRPDQLDATDQVDPVIGLPGAEAPADGEPSTAEPSAAEASEAEPSAAESASGEVVVAEAEQQLVTETDEVAPQGAGEAEDESAVEDLLAAGGAPGSDALPTGSLQITRVESTPPPTHYDLVVVATPWYPTERNPMWGTFVRDAVVAMGMHYEGRITVIHVDSSPAPEGETRTSWSFREERPEAHVLVIRAPYPGGTSRGRAMEIHRDALFEHAQHEIEHAKLVSAHVGGPTGAAIAPLLRKRTRFTLTEHATYVKALFKDVSAAVQYRAAVARAQRVLAVSDGTSVVLRRLCPEQSDLISAVPNPVRFDHLPLRDEPMRRPDRWLFVGNLVARKGVDLLVEAFAQEVEATQDQGRDLQLTLVGDGPMRAELEEGVAARGIADRVHFVGQVDPSQVTSYFRGHDVLVHLSDYETFGITLVEAAAAGLPVVVTRCGGPQETMVIPAGFGTCVFVDVRPEPGEVREAVNALRRDVSADELHTVRDLLRSFYGFERVADLLQKYVFGAVTATPLAQPLDLSIVVALQGMPQWQRARHGCDRAADMGASVTVVDIDGPVRITPAGIDILSAGDADRYNAVRYVERALVDRAPRAVLRSAEKLTPRLPNRYGRVALGAILQASRTQRRVANFSERVVYRRVWGLMRGQVMARRVERQPELEDLGRIDVIVHMGGRLTQLAYRLWSKNREAVVHNGSFTAATVASWWLETHHRPHPRQLQERS